MTTVLFPDVNHPLTASCLLVCHAAFMLAFTPPGSFLRLATFPIQFLVVSFMYEWIELSHSGLIPRTMLASLFMQRPFQYLDQVLLSKWSYEVQGPTKAFYSTREISTANRRKITVDLSSSLSSRLQFGFATTLSFRHLNTPYEVGKQSYFSDREKNYVPSRRGCLLRALAISTACYGFMDFTIAAAPNDACFPIGLGRYGAGCMQKGVEMKWLGGD